MKLFNPELEEDQASWSPERANVHSGWPLVKHSLSHIPSLHPHYYCYYYYCYERKEDKRK